MFAVIYRGFIYPGREEEYKKTWKIIADYFVKHCGAIGSTLHKTSEGEYIAYSRWPDRQARDASWRNNANEKIARDIQEAILQLRDCMDCTRPHDEICMDVVEDLLLPNFSENKT